MRLVFLFALLGFSGFSIAQQQEIQRALIQRDQQSAEFAAGLRSPQERAQLEALHARQLNEALVPLSADPTLANQLLPYQRSRMSDEREHVLRFAPPQGMKSVPDPDSRAPLPLPGGPRPGVDPVTPDGLSR